MESAASTAGPSAFGSLLRRYRVAAGLSQEALAERARISVRAVGALERGDRRSPQRETLGLLLQALGLDPEHRAKLESAARQSARRPIGRGVPGGERQNTSVSALPLALTTFVGHTVGLREIAEIMRERRLVTLTGPGGIGKTRIALERASDSAASGDSVRLVELAAIADPMHVASSIAAALGIQSLPSGTALDAVVAYLQRERVLLVLDNCEHVIAEVARVAEIALRRCSSLRILATSREPLRVAGESVYRVPALDVPTRSEAAALDPDRAQTFSAVALFVERARMVDRRFTLTDANAARIGQICAQLDGMPLAIELAAARANVLSVESIASKLDRRFALLARGDRNAPARHRRMWDTIAWSYEMLSAVERRVFERLSIFCGGCTLDVATDVCAGDDVAAAEVFESLASLVDKSLVIVERNEVETRYRMLESFREFAREHCAAHEYFDRLAMRHARAYFELARQLDHAFDTDSDAAIGHAVLSDLENWRAAIAWTLDAGHDVELGLRIVHHLCPPCDGVVPAQARAWLAHALKYVDERTPADLAAYLRAADYSVFAKACAEAEERIDARAFFRDGLVGDEFEVLRMLYRITRTLSILGRHVEAEPILAELLERCKADHGSRLNGMAYFYLAYQRLDENDLAAARVAIARGIGAFEAVGSPRGYARMLEVRRYVELLEGDRAAAVATCREELGIWRTEVDLVSLAGCLNNVAACLIASDRCDEAAPYAHEAFDLARSLDLPFRIVWSMQHLVAIATLAKVPALDAPCVAQLIGFLDARCRVLGIARDFIDQQEYDRIHALLIDSLSESEMVRLKQRGATLSEADALRFLAVTSARSDPALGGRASRLAGSV